MRFCPNCGKKTESRFCDSCTPKESVQIKKLNIKVCVSCKKYFYKNKWAQFSDLDDAIIRIVKNSIKNQNVSIKLPDFSFKPGVNVIFNIEITQDNEIHIAPGKLELTYCNICSKIQGDYFEGILQLRNPTKEIMNVVHSFMSDNLMPIKEVPFNNGINIKFINKNKLVKLGKVLNNKFGGTLKKSTRLYSKDRQTSKELHRINIFYSPPAFSTGDVIKVKSKLILITNIKKKTSGKNLITGKKTSIDTRDYKILKQFKTRVSKTHPHLEIIDPENYQSVPLQNKKSLKLGQKVKVVDDNGLFYIL